jgi:transporter family protein
MVELLSLLTAFCYGSSAVLTRRGMRNSNPLTGAVVGALVQVVLLTFVVLAIPPKNFNWAAFFYFVSSGLLASTFGRFLNYKSIEKLGVSLSATIIGSSPLFSTLFAVLFIGEDVALMTLMGTASIVTGIAITRSGGRMGSSILDATILLPIAAAAFYGISSVVRKVGLDILPESAFGALIGAGASLASFGAYFTVTGRLELMEINQESAKYFLASGLVVTIGWLSMFTALTTGNVSVVSALIGTNPLFSVILSLALLRDSENFNLRIALGCISIVVGAAAITLL